MIERLLSGRRLPAALERIDRPQAILLAIGLAVISAIGWLVGPLALAAAIAVQLTIGGFGAVALIGPARRGLGLARYTTLALAAVAATLFGRLLPGGVSLLFVPLVAVLLWSILWLELREMRDASVRTGLDLALTGIIFGGAAGIDHLFPSDAWPPPLALVALLAFLVGLRAAESRGTGGAQAVGQALLHALAVAQVGAAVALLDLQGVVGPAIIALAFYTWAGAAEALEGGARARAVAIEFGSLALLGLAVALLLHRG
jgi:hypothetical protein